MVILQEPDHWQSENYTIFNLFVHQNNEPLGFGYSSPILLM